MAIIKNTVAVIKWINEQRKKGACDINVACGESDFQLHSLDSPITIRDLEEDLDGYGDADVITERSFVLRSFKSAASGEAKTVSTLKLVVDLADYGDDDDDAFAGEEAVYDWEIWTSKQGKGAILRFSDGDSEYSLDVIDEDLERLYERLGDFLKVKPKKVVKGKPGPKPAP